MNRYVKMLILLCGFTDLAFAQNAKVLEKPRIIVTSDGEIDDQCSMIRFLLYTNECDVEGIITSSSQYHWQGHNWAGDDWIDPDLNAYAQVYPNLIKHNPAYPTPEYLRERTLLGNVKSEGEMEEVTAGSQLIVKVLLDNTDDRPIWLQAWGGTNTIARALKTIEEEHPERMAEVAKKMRFFFIWEQDRTYQDYIRPHWGKYEILTIISDQFEAIAYRWKQVQPEEMQQYFLGAWMKENILENHGPLCSLYKAHENGDFRSEGDSPAFLHTIMTGLRNMESPDWGGWGGRYVRVRENTWLDPVPVSGYTYPEGRWYGSNGWGRNSLREGTTSTPEQRREYFKPMWRWTEVMQNDFAARADWCVKSYEEANHPPVVVLKHAADLKIRPGAKVKLSARGTSDPDGDKLTYHWWQYQEAGSYDGTIEIRNANKKNASFTVPDDIGDRKTIHLICEVTDNGIPKLTRYQRVVVEIDLTANTVLAQDKSDNYLSKSWKDVATKMPSKWYGSDEARLVAENVLLSQKEIGGWEKNKPYHQALSASEKEHYLKDKAEIGATFDNGATIIELRFLAKVYAHFKDPRYKQAFEKGLDYIFVSQYENGGWPQFYPLRKGYYSRITYNDDAMVNTMKFLDEIISNDKEYTALQISNEIKTKAKKAFDKGIECILKTQIIVDNKPTVWCAQHDEKTLAPAKARSYELPSFSGAESVGITLLLMDIDNPSEAIIAAVNGAVEWFKNNKIEGIKLERKINKDGEKDLVVVEDKNASPIWARFYDLETSKPYFCSRDGIKKNSLAEISNERRNGYSWYKDTPEKVLKKYPEWKKKLESKK